mgnify:CR=1 FL=1
MITSVLAGCMIAFGLLLIYDCGLQVYRVGPSARNLSLAGLGLLIAGVWMPAAIGAALPDSVRLFLAASAALFLAGFCVYLVATWRCAHLRPRRLWTYVVVLGAGLRQGRYPSPLLRSRLEVGRLWWHLPLQGFDALDLGGLTRVAAMSVLPGRPQPVIPADGVRKAEQARYLVVCGGQGPDELVPEAHAMRDYLIAQGVPEERIIVEDASRTTAENLGNAQHLMASRSAAEGRRDDGCIVVTSEFHAVRTWLWARRAGLDCRGVVGKPTRPYYLVGSLARDYLALLKGYAVPVAAIAAALAIACALFA